jgi:hypothetical protein
MAPAIRMPIITEDTIMLLINNTTLSIMEPQQPDNNQATTPMPNNQWTPMPTHSTMDNNKRLKRVVPVVVMEANKRNLGNSPVQHTDIMNVEINIKYLISR